MNRRVVAGLLVALVAVAAGCTTKYTPPPSAGDNRYVGLGDSYTAGPLIPNPIVTADMPAGCLQSDHNYPHMLAPRLQLQFSDASCSGATTADMGGSQNVGAGTNAPQLDRLTAHTKVVTLGIGGNDIGFSEIATTCATGGLANPNGTPCQDTYVVNGDDTIADRINALGPNLAAVIEAIHTRSPQAKVFVVGYPAILPDTGDGCFPTMPITAGDVPYVRAKEQQLNAELQTVADAHNANYVDTYTPSIGHDACQPYGVRWVEPVVPIAAAPIHPNSLGEFGMAQAIVAALHAAGVPTT